MKTGLILPNQPRFSFLNVKTYLKSIKKEEKSLKIREKDLSLREIYNTNQHTIRTYQSND